jgi:enoyl-CoA hydratase/carnithine racemase/acyl dehydratase
MTRSEEQLRLGDVTLEIAGRQARIVIDRPGAMNALAPSVLTGLTEAVDRAVASGCTVLVLRGAGGSLSAGADLRYLQSVLDDEPARWAYITAIGGVIAAIEAAPLISIAVVDGYALAGGLELLLGCDLAVATHDAQLGDRHLEFGLLPGAGSSVRLSARVPAAAARRLLYLGTMVNGREAQQLGIVTESVPRGQLESTVSGLVDRLLRHDPVALLTMKKLHAAGAGLDTAQLPEALVAEREALLRHLSSDAVRLGLQTFAARSAGPPAAPPAAVPDAAIPSGEPSTPPVLGKWFEELAPGLVVQHAIRRTVTETDNVLFTTMSMNPAPVHLDAAYAAGTPFGAPLINSMFTLALVVGLSVPELTHGTIVAQLAITDVAFPDPLFAGDTVRVESEVVSARRSTSRPGEGVVVFAHHGFNQHGDPVCSLKRTGLMRCRPTGSPA